MDPSLLPAIIFKDFKISLPESNILASKNFALKDPNTKHYKEARAAPASKVKTDAYIGKLLEFGAYHFFTRLGIKATLPDCTIRTPAERRNLGFDADMKLNGIWKFTNPGIKLENHILHVKAGYMNWDCCGVWNLNNQWGTGGTDPLLDNSKNKGMISHWVLMGKVDEKDAFIQIGALFPWKIVLDNKLLMLPRLETKQTIKRVVYVEGTTIKNGYTGNLEYQRGLLDVQNKCVITDKTEVIIETEKVA